VRKVIFICSALSCCSLQFILVVLFSVAVSLINAAILDFELCFIALSYSIFVHVTVINIYGKRLIVLTTTGLTENMTNTTWSYYLQGY
jgi:hypothetical protein